MPASLSGTQVDGRFHLDSDGNLLITEDIRRIFCEHCELLGIRWTQSNPRNISVSHRDSVALMDEFIGPKS